MLRRRQRAGRAVVAHRTRRGCGSALQAVRPRRAGLAGALAKLVLVLTGGARRRRVEAGNTEVARRARVGGAGLAAGAVERGRAGLRRCHDSGHGADEARRARLAVAEGAVSGGTGERAGRTRHGQLRAVVAVVAGSTRRASGATSWLRRRGSSVAVPAGVAEATGAREAVLTAVPAGRARQALIDGREVGRVAVGAGWALELAGVGGVAGAEHAWRARHGDRRVGAAVEPLRTRVARRLLHFALVAARRTAEGFDGPKRTVLACRALVHRHGLAAWAVESGVTWARWDDGAGGRAGVPGPACLAVRLCIMPPRRQEGAGWARHRCRRAQRAVVSWRAHVADLGVAVGVGNPRQAAGIAVIEPVGRRGHGRTTEAVVPRCARRRGLHEASREAVLARQALRALVGAGKHRRVAERAGRAR